MTDSHVNEIYFSTDVETNGPIPGPFSMLSLGCAAYRLRSPVKQSECSACEGTGEDRSRGRLADGGHGFYPDCAVCKSKAAFVQLSTFSVNFATLPYATEDHDTMTFWAKHPEAYAATRQNTETPVVAMRRFTAWIEEVVKSQQGSNDRKLRPVFVGYPAGFDFLFVYWYLIRFCHYSPFSFGALDVKTYAAAALKTPYHSVGKSTMPRRWFSVDRPHTHLGIDDAMEQGEMFMRMLVEHLGGGVAEQAETPKSRAMKSLDEMLRPLHAEMESNRKCNQMLAQAGMQTPAESEPSSLTVKK